MYTEGERVAQTKLCEPTAIVDIPVHWTTTMASVSSRPMKTQCALIMSELDTKFKVNAGILYAEMYLVDAH